MNSALINVAKKYINLTTLLCDKNLVLREPPFSKTPSPSATTAAGDVAIGGGDEGDRRKSSVAAGESKDGGSREGLSVGGGGTSAANSPAVSGMHLYLTIRARPFVCLYNFESVAIQ